MARQRSPPLGQAPALGAFRGANRHPLPRMEPSGHRARSIRRNIQARKLRCTAVVLDGYLNGDWGGSSASFAAVVMSTSPRSTAAFRSANPLADLAGDDVAGLAFGSLNFRT